MFDDAHPRSWPRRNITPGAAAAAAAAAAAPPPCSSLAPTCSLHPAMFIFYKRFTLDSPGSVFPRCARRMQRTHAIRLAA
jgi:hypothetical protein